MVIVATDSHLLKLRPLIHSGSRIRGATKSTAPDSKLGSPFMSRAVWVIHERLKKYSLAGAMMMVLQLWFVFGGFSSFVAGVSFSNG